MKAWASLAAAALVMVGGQAGAAGPERGDWNPGANKLRDGSLSSPDGEARLGLRGGRLVMIRRGVARPIETPFAPATIEAVWSRDGRRVAVTGSDGGAVGTWSVVLLDADGRDVGAGLAETVARLGAGLAHCDGPEAVNATAAGWARRGSRLLMRLEVPPHSSCANMGEVRFVLIEAEALGRSAVVSRARAEAEVGRSLR